MTTFFYSVWLGFAALFLLIALWAKLEEYGDKHQRQNPGDFFNQGIFLLGCAGVAIAFDHFWMQTLVASMAPDWIPLWFFRLLLFPAVIYLGALTVGPSKKILISKAPKVSIRKR